MPSLTDLPPELQIHILSFISTLQFEPISSSKSLNPAFAITPPICRVNHFLRREALALYAKNHSFSFPPSDQRGKGFGTWLDVMDGAEVLGRIWRGLMWSEHWRAERPERGERHVGFYVRVDIDGGAVDGGGRGREIEVKTGTSPVANDTRGMRLESVNLLRDVIVTYLRRREEPAKGLRRQDVEVLAHAMGIVARHPIPAFDLEQSEQGRQARRRIWDGMESELRALLGQDGSGERTHEGKGEGNGLVTGSGTVFFTPY